MRWQEIGKKEAFREIGDVRLVIDRVGDSIRSATAIVDGRPVLRLDISNYNHFAISEPAPPPTRKVYVLNGTVGTIAMRQVFDSRDKADEALRMHQQEFGDKADRLCVTEAEEQMPQDGA